eukprot:1075427-Pyramimonas_sp.AAC.1
MSLLGGGWSGAVAGSVNALLSHRFTFPAAKNSMRLRSRAHSRWMGTETMLSWRTNVPVMTTMPTPGYWRPSV